MSIQKKVDSIVKKNNSLLCVGLDPVLNKIPSYIQNQENAIFVFNKSIIDATADLVCAYKPNSAFYEAAGTKGIEQLKMTCDYIRKTHPEIFLILDAKRGDIGSTNAGYIQFTFDWLQADAITLHPYLGAEAIKPFLDRQDKTSIILCRTSNPGAGEFQDLMVEDEPLYKRIAAHVVYDWNKHGNCMLVVGATYPQELAEIRAMAGEMTFLIPGIGAQGGDVEKTVKAGKNSQGAGMIISSSRSIIYASNGPDYAEKAREAAMKLSDEINNYR